MLTYESPHTGHGPRTERRGAADRGRARGPRTAGRRQPAGGEAGPHVSALRGQAGKHRRLLSRLREEAVTAWCRYTGRRRTS